MSNEKEDKLKINNIGLGESITKIASQFLERIYHYDKRKENKIAVGDTPPPAKYAEWQDLWIDTSASLDMWNVQFIQSEHQTIYCIDFFGNRHSEDFQLKDGTPYTVEVIAEEGYNPGKPNIESGIIHSDIILYAETEATPIEYTIYIIQSEHQLIKVLVNGIYYTTDTSFIFGTSWSASIIPDPGYTAGQLNMNSGVLTEDITVQATAATLNYYWIHISKYTHQRISVHVGDVVYTDDIKLPYGTEWRAVIEADEGYTAGTLNMTNGILTQDITISATEEVLKQFTIHIAQYDHQHIIVTANDATYRTDITLPYGTEWSARVEADTGYTAGTINNSGGTLTEDVWLTAEESTINTYTITFPSFDNQEIIVTIDGVDYKDSPIHVEYGTEWSARVEVTDDRYTPGTVNIPSGIITADVQLNASVAQPIMHTIYITDYAHQTIYVSANGTEYSSKQVPSVQLLHKTEYTVRIEAEENFIAGTLSTTGGILTEDVTITATEAVANTFNVVIIQTANQTVTVIDLSTGTRHTESFEISRRGAIEIQVVANDGYLAGKPTINSTVFDGDTYYVIADTTVSAEAATKDNRIHFFIEDRPDQTITVTYKGTIYQNGEDFYANPGETFDTKVTALILGFTAGDCKFAPTYTVPSAPSTIWITAEAPYQKSFVNIYLDEPMPDLYENYSISVLEPNGANKHFSKADGNPFQVRRGSTLRLSSSYTKVTMKDPRKTPFNVTVFTVSGDYVACEDTHLQFRNPQLARDGTCELSEYSYYRYPSHGSYNIKVLAYSIIKNYQLEGDTTGTKSQRSFSGAEAFDIDKLNGAVIERHRIINPAMSNRHNEEIDAVAEMKRCTSNDNDLRSVYGGQSNTGSASFDNSSYRVEPGTVTVRVDNNDPNQFVGIKLSSLIDDEACRSYEAYKNSFSTALSVPMNSNIICVVFPNDGYRAGDPQGKYVHGHMITCIENMTITATPATPLNGSTDRNYFGAIEPGATAKTDRVTLTPVAPLDQSTYIQIVDYNDSSRSKSTYMRGSNPAAASFDVDGFRLYTNPDTGSSASGIFNMDIDYDKEEFTSSCDIYIKQNIWPETRTTRAKTSTLKFRSDPDGGTGFVFFCNDSGYFSGRDDSYNVQQMFFSSESAHEDTRTYPIKVGSAYTAITYPKQNVITVGTCNQPSGTMPESGLTLTCTGSVVNQYNTLFYGDVYDTLGEKITVQYMLPNESTWRDVDRSKTSIDLPIRTKYRIHKNTSDTIHAYIFANYLHYPKFDTVYTIGPKIDKSTGYNQLYSNLGNVMLRCEKYNVEHAITVNIYDSKNPEFSLSSSRGNGASGSSNTFTTQKITAYSQDTRTTFYDSYNDNPYVSYRLSTSNSVNSGRYSLNTSQIYVAPTTANATTTLYVYDEYTYSIVDASNADTPDFTLQVDCKTDPNNYYGFANGSSLHSDFGKCSVDNPVYRDISNGAEVQYSIKAILFDVRNNELLVELNKAGTLTSLSEYTPNIAIRSYNNIQYMTQYTVQTKLATIYFVASSVEDKGTSYVLHYSGDQLKYYISALNRLRSKNTSDSYWKFDFKFTRTRQSYRSLTFGTHQDANYQYAGYWAADALKAPIQVNTGTLTSDIVHGISTNTKVELKIKAFYYRRNISSGNTTMVIEVENLTDPTLRYIDTSLGIDSYIMTEVMSSFIYDYVSRDAITELIPQFDSVNGNTAYVPISGDATRYTDFEKNFVSGQNQWTEIRVDNFVSNYIVDAMFSKQTGNIDILKSIYVII